MIEPARLVLDIVLRVIAQYCGDGMCQPDTPPLYVYCKNLRDYDLKTCRFEYWSEKLLCKTKAPVLYTAATGTAVLLRGTIVNRTKHLLVKIAKYAVFCVYRRSY